MSRRICQSPEQRAAVAATVAALSAEDDRDRVHALQRALRQAQGVLEDVAELVEAVYLAPAHEHLPGAVASALHEARVALSLEHGEA